MTDLSAMIPSAIDAELYVLWQDKQNLTARYASTADHLCRIRNSSAPGTTHNWSARGGYVTHDMVTELESDLASIRAQIAAIRASAEPFESEFTRRGGWRRYFLVTNGNGHVHREMTCSTCYPTTSYAWLPSLSGCDESAMVDEWGERACTVCFPNAPTYERFNHPSRADVAEREAREAEKRARESAREEKAIHNLEGGPLKVRAGMYASYRTGEIKQSYETYKTKVAARNALSEAVYCLALYGPTHPSRFQDTIADLIPSLVAAGFDIAKIAVAAQKRARKDGASAPFYAVEKALADALN